MGITRKAKANAIKKEEKKKNIYILLSCDVTATVVSILSSGRATWHLCVWHCVKVRM